MDFPTLPLFFAMFFAIYLIAHFIIFRNWSPKLRPEAASCLISLAHGTPAVFLAGHAIFSDQTHGFASANTRFQNSVLEYSIAYFLMDLCHYFTFYPSDILFIAHHLATLFVFLTCRYLVFHGAYAVLGLLVLAEVTSLFQNVWTLAGARRADSKTADQSGQTVSWNFFNDVPPVTIYTMFTPTSQINCWGTTMYKPSFSPKACWPNSWYLSNRFPDLTWRREDSRPRLQPWR